VVKPPVLAKQPRDKKSRNGASKRSPAASEQVGQSIPSHATDHARPETLSSPVVLVDPIEELCGLLSESQHQSGKPDQFERHLTEAFSSLGFEAAHIGGSGETDIYLEARLGKSSYSIVVDAKSTASSKVPDAQINWPVIDSHRVARGATFAAVVGPSFGGGQLLRFASQYNVVLLRTDMVCDLLRLHARTPLSLFELRDLFLSPGLADVAVKTVRERHSQHRRHWELIAEVVQTMARFGPDGLKRDNLYHILRALTISSGRPLSDVPTQQDVIESVAFLASRAVGVLAEVPGSDGAYQLTMSVQTARERLNALTRAVNQTRTDQPAESPRLEPGLTSS
jgi:hypothetical protein